jgi:hypothetical protein
MSSRFIVFFFLACVGFPAALRATHIVGGEITYRCLGNDDYEVTLTLYRDCYTGVPPFDLQGSIGVFTGDWVLYEQLLLTPMGDDTLLNESLAGVCVHRTRYVGTVSLANAAADDTFYLAYQRCCRNNLVVNLANPLSTGFTALAELTPAARQVCNSGATFAGDPLWLLCNHVAISGNQAATDVDGDSLAYRLCTPLAGATEFWPQPQPPDPGPYAEIEWASGYSLANPLGGQPLAIDAATAVLSGQPNLLGQFAVGVCVDEYRAGQLLNTVRRDFHLSVLDCTIGAADATKVATALALFPNPAIETVRLDGVPAEAITSVEIYTARGDRFTVPRQGHTLDVSSLPPGVYRVVVHAGRRVESADFVKLR